MPLPLGIRPLPSRTRTREYTIPYDIFTAARIPHLSAVVRPLAGAHFFRSEIEVQTGGGKVV